MQNLGTFETAQLAAAAVAHALAVGDDKDMDSPRKQAHRGECGCARMLRTSLTLRAHALYLTGCAGSVKTKVKCAASPAAEPGAAENPFTQPAAAGAMPVLATPCFLPKEALEAMLERGVVGSVARVLN